MYKVFLVDDEELVIKSLMASVDWNGNGFELVGYALSGAEAYDTIEQLKPDVVFTDIRMPGMSGLELIKELQKFPLQPMVCVISGYAEFALAQKAINYGAFGYCLKPFDETEIAMFLKKASTVLETRNIPDEGRILDYIEDAGEEAVEYLNRSLKNAGIEPHAAAGIKVIVSVGKSRLHPKGCSGTITLRIGFGMYAYLVQIKAEEQLSFDMPPIIMEGVRGIGVSKIIHQAEAIKSALEEAEIKAYRFFTLGSKYSFAQREMELTEKQYGMKAMEEAITNNDNYALYATLQAMEDQFLEGELHIRHAVIVYNQVMMYLGRNEGEIYEDYIFTFSQLERIFKDVTDMLKFLKKILSEKMRTNTFVQRPHGHNRTFNAIFDYVNEHFREDISIPFLSRQFNLNGNYISQLFKKENGTTLTQYLSNLRIEYACGLLVNTDYSINEISEKAGYTDYFYFSRLFKRMKGLAPSAYRSRHI
ncbi:response regulator [Paenibacillus sp. S150]|uniref:response regulator transcription factor n=1 Tax=Paenibacillus sp. S150 TaxID=2749826 RepID=UPI001C5815AD|nr:response regulator [Paenibacillus sp. S150]MBW4080023.1 response regulator [Paenibacillus sp. S150]